MADREKVQTKRKDAPAETPKKLPAAFPDKFDADQAQKENSVDKKRGKGARFHGSM
jgi:hypothetical protein